MLTLSTGNSVSNDSLVFRIKYAYAQFNLDDWMTKGSWARFGIQQTPWVDFEEGIYRYRFQGTVFAERVPLPTTMTSSDAGASFHYNFPSNYGDIHVGVYNGENYQRVEANDQKALEFRGTRAAVRHGHAGSSRASRALRLLQRSLSARRRAQAGDGQRDLRAQVHQRRLRLPQCGRSTLAIVAGRLESWILVLGDARMPFENGSSWEALLRYDHWIPNTSTSLVPAASSPIPGRRRSTTRIQNRTIVGVSYWFPHQGTVSTALML